MCNKDCDYRFNLPATVLILQNPPEWPLYLGVSGMLPGSFSGSLLNVACQGIEVSWGSSNNFPHREVTLS